MQKFIYPNPQKIREDTVSLNGEWDFSYDAKKWMKINVPFCPESKLSGIENKDLIPKCFYKRKFNVNKRKGDVLLNFGAVDYICRVFVNGKCVGEHEGGYTSFSFDISQYINDGENELYLEVIDEKLSGQARGKQSNKLHSYGCFYTKVTGIWQDVWLEYTSKIGIKTFYFYPHIDKSSVTLLLETIDTGIYDIEVSYNGVIVGKERGEIEFKKSIDIALSELHLWEIGKGDLYDVKISYNQDTVYTYFGMREVEYKGYDFLINKKRVYQKLVLDQGYNPNGLCTMPNIQEMERDIQLALDLGFNGARLHQKVFQSQFLYLCDKKGYMIWGEFASWGVNYSNMDGCGNFLSQWTQVVLRDFNHPSIITWCPLNEVWEDWNDNRIDRDIRFIDTVYFYTKQLDSTRPCVDVSGGHHGHVTDLYDFHCYEDIKKLQEYIDALEEKDVLDVLLLHPKKGGIPYKTGEPVNASEVGGFKFGSTSCITQTDAFDGDSGWGYGEGEKEAEAFIRRYKELIDCLATSKKISGFCYTQLYDIEQEQNGFYNYDRSDKLTAEEKDRIRKINDKLQ